MISVDWEVLLVEGVVSADSSFGSSDDWEDEWLSIVVSVGTDSEVDLVGVGVVLESKGESEDWVSWSLLDVGELDGGGIELKLSVQGLKAVHNVSKRLNCLLKDLDGF